jgi:response regulator RpfG family c-di-GMP phosphodiesterase
MAENLEQAGSMLAGHPMTEPSLPSAAPAPDGVPCLLLVDDEASVLSALRRLFRPQGWQVLQAGGALEALAVLAAQPVDLVISDMRMPGMDGAALLEAVRQHDPSIVRILLTGYADITSTVAAINRGEIHRYIAKPWDDRDLVLMVREALSRRDLERQNARLQTLTQTQNLELRDLNQHLEARVAARTAELGQVNAMLEKSYEELNTQFMMAVTVFSGLMEMRQDGIAGHSRRVGALARGVAQRLKLDPSSCQEVYLAALLHDIGKIGYPDRMLGKPVSTFSPDELARYRRHPLDGEAALMPLAALHGVARIIRQHHERLDGHGFPDALPAASITLGARIVAAASDYDGLLSGQLGERKLKPAEARQALRGSVDTRYDPRVVQALFEVLDGLACEAVPQVELEPRELLPGMVLAQDLLSPKGSILLAAGHVFEPRVIRQVSEFGVREGLRIRLQVLRSSVPVPGSAIAVISTSSAPPLSPRTVQELPR